MKKTWTAISLFDITNSLAENVKARLGYEIFYQGNRDIRTNFRILLKTENKNILVAYVCIKRHKLSWWTKKYGHRFHCKYFFPADIISILTNRIETTFKNIYPYKIPAKKTTQSIVGISLILSNDILERIKNHVFTTLDIECGGYLIGRLQWSDDEQNVIGYVDDIYHDDSVGSAAHFTFTAQYGLKAYSYCLKNYRNEDGISSKNIIGNYHSHGNFNAFFSGQDRTMIFAGTAPEFYLVFSPGKKEITALFKNKQQQLFAVGLTQDTDFRYCEPTIPQISIDYFRKGKG